VNVQNVHYQHSHKIRVSFSNSVTELKNAVQLIWDGLSQEQIKKTVVDTIVIIKLQ